MPDNAAPGTAVATRDNSPVGQFQRQLESRAREIHAALPGHITPDKFQRTVLTAVAQNPDLLKADRNSLILACYKAAQDALLPDGREAALVTFNTRFKDPDDGQWKSKKLVQYMPMVYGLRKKILQSTEVVSLEVNVVYKAEVAKGTFLYEVGLEPPLRHRPSLDLSEEETADDQIVAAYSIATMRDGTKSYEIMRRFEIDKVRQVSQTGAVGRTDRSGKAIEPKGPWVDWFAEMAKKTVMRRHAKTLPMSGDVLIDTEGREFESGASTALALGREEPDEPTAITDHAEETPHDPETGEIHEDEDTPGASGTAHEAPSAAESTAATSATGSAPPSRARRQRQTEEAAEPNPPAPPEDAADSGTDEIGVTKHPAEDKANELLEQFSKAETILDLERLYGAAAQDVDAMPDEIREVVIGGYNRHRVRLRTKRVPVQQTEEAK